MIGWKWSEARLDYRSLDNHHVQSTNTISVTISVSVRTAFTLSISITLNITISISIYQHPAVLHNQRIDLNPKRFHIHHYYLFTLTLHRTTESDEYAHTANTHHTKIVNFNFKIFFNFRNENSEIRLTKIILFNSSFYLSYFVCLNMISSASPYGYQVRLTLIGITGILIEAGREDMDIRMYWLSGERHHSCLHYFQKQMKTSNTPEIRH